MADFSTEELALLVRLGIPVPKQPEHKFIRINFVCKLCKTTTSQLFRMVKTANNTWVKDKEIDFLFKDINNTTIEESNLTLSICQACRGVLMQKEKSELVSMLLDFYCFDAPNTDSKEIQNKEYKMRYRNERDCTSLV